MPTAVTVRGGKMIQKFINKRLNSNADDDEDIFFSSSISITSSSAKYRFGSTTHSTLKNARSTPNLPQIAMEQTTAMPPLSTRDHSRPSSGNSDDIHVTVGERYYPSLSYSATSESSSGSSGLYRRPRSAEDIVQWMDDRVLQAPSMQLSLSESTSRREIKVAPKRWNTVNYRHRLHDPYALQRTLQEQDRLIAQHYLLRTAFKGYVEKYITPPRHELVFFFLFLYIMFYFSDFSAPVRQLLEKGVVVLDVGYVHVPFPKELSFQRFVTIKVLLTSMYLSLRPCILYSCGPGKLGSS